MKVLLEEAKSEIEIKRSRFISIAIPTKTLEEVKLAVQKTRCDYADATHVVHAAVVGDKGTLFSSSDDKEPKNTAGRPSLEVLKGSGITNITVCTIRYFGGTLLGTGGLVKAYGDSTKEVLKAVKTEELIERAAFSIMLPYELYNRVKRAIEDAEATSLVESFDVAITIKGQIPLTKQTSFISSIKDIGQGKISFS